MESEERKRRSGKSSVSAKNKREVRRKEGGGSRKKTIKHKDEAVRLNRFIANAGICARREADHYIEAGFVTVNGEVVQKLGTKVLPGDEVRFKGRKLNPEKKVYLLLNKPKDSITTVDDPHAKLTVMDLVRGACRERIYPVGRLDRHTTGVLLLTNDGELAKKLTHPGHKVAKIYHAQLDKPLTKSDMRDISKGVTLKEGNVEIDEIVYTDHSDLSMIGLQIHSGQNRVVRRIFEHFGYKVKKLDRVSFAGLTKKNVPRRRWRHLTEKEVNMLKMNIFK